MDCFDKDYLLTMLVREYIDQENGGGKIDGKVGDTILWVWVLDDKKKKLAELNMFNMLPLFAP